MKVYIYTYCVFPAALSATRSISSGQRELFATTHTSACLVSLLILPSTMLRQRGSYIRHTVIKQYTMAKQTTMYRLRHARLNSRGVRLKRIAGLPILSLMFLSSRDCTAASPAMTYSHTLCLYSRADLGPPRPLTAGKTESGRERSNYARAAGEGERPMGTTQENDKNNFRGIEEVDYSGGGGRWPEETAERVGDDKEPGDGGKGEWGVRSGKGLGGGAGEDREEEKTSIKERVNADNTEEDTYWLSKATIDDDTAAIHGEEDEGEEEELMRSSEDEEVRPCYRCTTLWVRFSPMNSNVLVNGAHPDLSSDFLTDPLGGPLKTRGDIAWDTQ